MIDPEIQRTRRRGAVLLWSGLLSLATLFVFGRTIRYDFVNFDDPVYVTENEQVARGLSWDGVRWAFASGDGPNWHPVTWLSLMLDVSLFGMRPGGLHGVSAGIHLANVLLLFAVLVQATGSVGRSGAAALLWGVHPMRAESVAWISERKDVLFVFFGLLSLLCYVRWVRTKRSVHYLLSLGALALGLMSKSMLVTLPCALLLLDVWPLRRREAGDSWRRLAVEKIPYFALSVVFSVLAYVFQSRAGAVAELDEVSLTERMANTLYSYGAYLATTFWPANLAVYYPRFRAGVPAAETWCSLAVLLAITWAAWRLRGRRPYVLAGWLWFVGTLFPVSGVVPLGAHQRADRFLYWPHIGMSLSLVWLADDLVRGTALARRGAGVLLVIASMALMGVAAVYTATYENSRTLYEHALRTTRENDWAHLNLGIYYRRRGEAERALRHYQQALRISPVDPDIYFSTGFALQELGRNLEAVDYYRQAVSWLTDSPQHQKKRPLYLNNWGDALRTAALEDPRRTDLLHEGIVQLRRAIEADPKNSKPHINLGLAWLQAGELEKAEESLERGVSLNPENARGWMQLGYVQEQRGRRAEARRSYAEALRRAPGLKTSGEW